jgi:hypothetical protein
MISSVGFLNIVMGSRMSFSRVNPNGKELEYSSFIVSSLS